MIVMLFFVFAFAVLLVLFALVAFFMLMRMSTRLVLFLMSVIVACKGAPTSKERKGCDC